MSGDQLPSAPQPRSTNNVAVLGMTCAALILTSWSWNLTTPVLSTQGEHRRQSQVELPQSLHHLDHKPTSALLTLSPGASTSGDTVAVLPSGSADQFQKLLRKIVIPSRDSAQRMGIQLAKAETRTLSDYVEANGTVEYDKTRLAQLSSRVTGTVWRVEKNVGDHVNKGDVLSILQSHQVGLAKSEFLQAVVQVQHKQVTLKRLKSLPDKVVPERQIFEAEAALREARIKLVNRQQTLSNLGLTVNIDDKRNITDEELQTELHFAGLPAEIAAKLDRKQAPANLISITSPFDGVVIRREISLGEIVEPTLTQFVIADTSRMWILLDIRKEDAARIKVGCPLVFQSDASVGVVQGTINWISSQVDQESRTVQVRAEVAGQLASSNQSDLQHRALRANTFGKGRIRVREATAVVTAPIKSIQTIDGRHVVFVTTAQMQDYLPRTVKLGIEEQEWVEILGGLQAGETVVTDGSHLLKSELAQRQLTDSQ